MLFFKKKKNKKVLNIQLPKPNKNWLESPDDTVISSTEQEAIVEPVTPPVSANIKEFIQTKEM